MNMYELVRWVLLPLWCGATVVGALYWAMTANAVLASVSAGLMIIGMLTFINLVVKD